MRSLGLIDGSLSVGLIHHPRLSICRLSGPGRAWLRQEPPPACAHTQPGRRLEGSRRVAVAIPVRCLRGHVGSPGSENGLMAHRRCGRRRADLQPHWCGCSSAVSHPLAGAEQPSSQSGRLHDAGAHSIPIRVCCITSDRRVPRPRASPGCGLRAGPVAFCGFSGGQGRTGQSRWRARPLVPTVTASGR
jgi:hypothetical protein